MARSKPKILWSCEFDHANREWIFIASLPWYGIEIKTRATLREVELYKDPELSWIIISQMTSATNQAVERATRTITDSLDHDENFTKATGREN